MAIAITAGVVVALEDTPGMAAMVDLGAVPVLVAAEEAGLQVQTRHLVLLHPWAALGAIGLPAVAAWDCLEKVPVALGVPTHLPQAAAKVVQVGPMAVTTRLVDFTAAVELGVTHGQLELERQVKPGGTVPLG
jgi:hypothetical protein